MRADTVSAPLLSSDSHLRGARMVQVASALFPARASPGRGCAHNPTHRPACPTPTPHLSHATLCTPPRMRDNVRVARERWGVGVRHAERTRGHAHTQCGARPASLQRSPVGMPLGSAPPHCMCMGRAKGRGGIPACLHANGGRGCLPRWLRAPSHPRGPSYLRSLPEWGCHPALHLCRQGVSRRGVAPSLRWWSTPLHVLCSLG